MDTPAASVIQQSSLCVLVLFGSIKCQSCDLAVPVPLQITGIAHGSSGWVEDGLALSLPALPRSSALSLGSEAYYTLKWELFT